MKRAAHWLALASGVFVLGCGQGDLGSGSSSTGSGTKPGARAEPHAGAAASSGGTSTNRATPTTDVVQARARRVQALRQVLGPRLNRSSSDLLPQRQGAHVTHLQGRFQNAQMVRRRADGSLEHACTDHVEGAVRFLEPEASE